MAARERKPGMLTSDERAAIPEQSRDPVAGAPARMVLDLQQKAGNAATTAAVQRMITVQRLEAPMHEAAERQGLTSQASGARSAQGLTDEEASAVYRGNWMRDVNQALVPLVVRHMPPEAAFAALSYMAARKFGLAMTPEQLGYYIPAEHIDSPAGLTNQDDVLPGQPGITAPRVPGAQARPNPYVTPQEDLNPSTSPTLFAVDQAGVAGWIRRTNQHVERRLELAARRGRNPDGMLHFGAALHAIEDLFAHSNWVEMAVNKVLADNPGLVPSLSGSARQSFTYSVEQTVRTQGGHAVRRPVLMTGSFTGGDTQVSLASEFGKFLSNPLPPAPGGAEREAQRRMVSVMLRTFEQQLRSNPDFRNGVRRVLRENGVPDFAATVLENAPLEAIYNLTNIPIPDAIRERVLNPIQDFIHGIVSTHILQPIGNQVMSEGINAHVADTSLVNVLRRQQQEAAAPVGPGNPQADHDSAVRHVDALQHTPERVVAGPTHSQIAKDHTNSPFFGLAFKMATEAVRRMRERMVVAWAALAGGHTTAFDFSRGHFPAVSPNDREETTQARDLYDESRARRDRAARESLATGNRIVAEGGLAEGMGVFKPYDISAMRADSASQVRAIAVGLRGLHGSPAQVALALATVNGVLSRYDQGNERLSRARQAIDRAAAGVRSGGGQASNAVALDALATEIDGYASTINTATTHAAREDVNNDLRAARERALREVASSPNARSALALAVIALIDRQIADTAPAYTGEQRAILESGQTDRFREHTGPRGDLPRAAIDLGPASRATDPAWHGGVRPPEVAAVIEESRLLMDHPYESTWWVAIVRDHISRNQLQIAADIEARNAGYAVLRRPGERDHHH
jgi:hypothetical protein